MFDADTRQRFAERQKHLEPVEGARAEQPVGLFDHRAVGVDLFGRRAEQMRLVRDDGQADLIVERLAADMAPGQHGRVHQRVERGALEPDRAIGMVQHGQGTCRLPAGRYRQAGIDHDTARIMARRIQDAGVPRQAEHVGGTQHPALRRIGGRQELELRLDRVDAVRHVDGKGIDGHRMTPPAQVAPAGMDAQPGKQLDRRLGSVEARQPFGI